MIRVQRRRDLEQDLVGRQSIAELHLAHERVRESQSLSEIIAALSSAQGSQLGSEETFHC